MSGPWDLPPPPPPPAREEERGCLIPLVVGAFLLWGGSILIGRIIETVSRFG